MSGSGHQVGELAGDHHDHAEDGENGEQHWNHLLSGVVGYVANATRRPGVCQGSITGYCTTQHRWSGTPSAGCPTTRLALAGSHVWASYPRTRAPRRSKEKNAPGARTRAPQTAPAHPSSADRAPTHNAHPFLRRPRTHARILRRPCAGAGGCAPALPSRRVARPFDWEGCCVLQYPGYRTGFAGYCVLQHCDQGIYGLVAP